MLAGTKFTGVQTNGVVDLAGDNAITDVTIGSGTYANIPTNFTDVTFDTGTGNINFANSQVTTAGTTFLFDGSITGGNFVVFNFNFNFTLATDLNNAAFINTGTGTLTISPLVGTVSFSGIPIGSRVSLFYANGDLSETAISSNTVTNFTTNYLLNTSLTYRIFASGYQQTSGVTTVATVGQNTVNFELLESAGYTDNASIVLRNVDATVVNAAGNISIYTSNSAIVVHDSMDIREGLSVINREWIRSDLGGSANVRLPVVLDSVKGLEIIDNWALINTENTLNEGWVQRYSNAALSNVYYRFITENNQFDVNLRLVYDGVEQTATTYSGEQNRVLELDFANNSNIAFIAKIKEPTVEFIRTQEIVRQDSNSSFQRFYRNTITNYLERPDSSVTESIDLADYGTVFQLNQTQITVDPDENGITHTFDRIVEVGTSVNDRQTLLNQFAAIATVEPRYDDKFFELNANGTITMESGTWVRYIDQSPLSGSLLSILQLETNQGVYVQPESRVITVSRIQGATRDASYVVYNTDTGNVLIDADGIEVTGNVNANLTTKIWTIIENTDTNVSIGWMGSDVAYSSLDDVLTSEGVEFEIVPGAVDVVTPPPTNTTDDNTTGLLAWKDIIDDATIDAVNRSIIIPTETDTGGNVIKTYNAAYFYFAWRRWVLEDITRLRYGEAVFAEHQFRPSGATNESHKLKPGVYFNDRWKLDVDANRLTTDIVRLEASALGRKDPNENSGLVYASPLANGANSMAEVIVSGAATQAISDTFNKAVEISQEVDKLKNVNGWIISNGQLIGLAPMPTNYSPNTDYRPNIDQS